MLYMFASLEREKRAKIIFVIGTTFIFRVADELWYISKYHFEISWTAECSSETT